DVELIHSQHPLVKAIVKFYDQQADRVNPVSKLQVKCGAVQSADYLYLLHLVEVHGMRGGNYLEGIFVPVDNQPPLSPDLSEVLLTEMLVNGETLAVELQLPGGVLATCRRAADDALGRRVEERRVNLTRMNQAQVTNRLASLSGTYEARR